jgi:hypothetical protein
MAVMRMAEGVDKAREQLTGGGKIIALLNHETEVVRKQEGQERRRPSWPLSHLRVKIFT